MIELNCHNFFHYKETITVTQKQMLLMILVMSESFIALSCLSLRPTNKTTKIFVPTDDDVLNSIQFCGKIKKKKLWVNKQNMSNSHRESPVQCWEPLYGDTHNI
jgi:hypothetical protein